MRNEVQKEMAKEQSNMLVMMSSLANLWKLFTAKGACLDTATGAVLSDYRIKVDVIGECWSADEEFASSGANSGFGTFRNKSSCGVRGLAFCRSCLAKRSRSEITRLWLRKL